MKRYIARRTLITRLAELLLFTLCFAQSVRAQYSGTYVLYQDLVIPPVGLAPGQSLRFTLFNPDGAPVRAQVKLHHTGGMLVALGDASVRSGAFHSFDFKHSDIPLPGEAGTGRIQIQGSVRLTFSEAITPIAISMEIITDGTSNTFLAMEKPPSPGGSEYDVATGNRKKGILMGIVPGQTLRVTLFNPLSPGAEAQSNSVGGHVKIFDGSGNLISQSPELAIPPGEFRSFDFNRALFPLPGEPGTGRLQARFEIVANRPESARPSRDLIITDLVSFEVIDNRTGKTTVLTGHQCLVFYLGGIPE